MFSRAFFLSVLPIASAHFQLTWPAGRGFDDQLTVNFPCGGFEDPSATRQVLPLSGAFPIQLNMEHTTTRGVVVLALGNSPTGDDYTTILTQTWQETGPQSFCVGGITLPAGLNITDGTNGTIQVVTNGDPSGGLYQCADVTFTSAALSQADYDSHCTNSTGVSASYIGSDLPNGTASTGSETSASASSSASAAATSSTANGGAQQTAAAFLLGAAGFLAFAAL